MGSFRRVSNASRCSECRRSGRTANVPRRVHLDEVVCCSEADVEKDRPALVRRLRARDRLPQAPDEAPHKTGLEVVMAENTEQGTSHPVGL